MHQICQISFENSCIKYVKFLLKVCGSNMSNLFVKCQICQITDRQIGVVHHNGHFVYVIAVHSKSACSPNFEGFPWGMQVFYFFNFNFFKIVRKRGIIKEFFHFRNFLISLETLLLIMLYSLLFCAEGCDGRCSDVAV